ncbi:hypothetical protein [Microbulbifer aggregans]|uniref:hypothetical protein n=1 Tax=Microbulbifer aggregans TaxID=1769779 RepID=UPI001CFDCD2C|nr:hypothetical protein [Microbulbifer aggregans]
MKRFSRGLNVCVIALLSAFALGACGKKTETHDPDIAPTAVEPASPVTEHSPGDSPNSEGQLICNATWFEWVNKQILSIHSEDVTNQYPSGLPAVGSDEWFTAVDKLTGGDGAHGPDGGSDEWCFMIQQRLSSASSAPDSDQE